MSAALRFYFRSGVGRKPWAFKLNAEEYRPAVTRWLDENADMPTQWWWGAAGALYIQNEDLAFAARLRWC